MEVCFTCILWECLALERLLIFGVIEICKYETWLSKAFQVVSVNVTERVGLKGTLPFISCSLKCQIPPPPQKKDIRNFYTVLYLKQNKQIQNSTDSQNVTVCQSHRRFWEVLHAVQCTCSPTDVFAMQLQLCIPWQQPTTFPWISAGGSSTQR